MSYKAAFIMPDGKEIGVDSTNLIVPKLIEPIEASTESWVKEPIYGVESVVINPKTMECVAHYSVEKFFGNKKDEGAPLAGKMRIKFLGAGTEVVFSDGSIAKNDLNEIFKSPYVTAKIQEFNNYYVKEKGYQPFTQEDARTFKFDLAQVLRKIFSYSLTNKVEIKFINGTAMYGLFSNLFGRFLDKIFGAPGGAEGGLKQFIIPAWLNRGVPFCIVYTHTNEKGEKAVMVKRFLYAGVYSKKISQGTAKSGSGGKEIGKVK
jgi:hypothetical protein